MSDSGTFILGLLDMAGNPAVDTGVEVNLNYFGTSEPFLRQQQLSFPPKRAFTVPVIPLKKVNCWVLPTRYRGRQSGYYNILFDETVSRDLNVFRAPDKWGARFAPWAQLPDALSELKKVLLASPDVRVKNKDKLVPKGDFTGQNYDDVSGEPTVLAKAALLNLFFKLTRLNEPVNDKKTWFSFVRRILVIGRERFVAVVDPEMGDLVRAVKDRIGDFKKDYKNAPAQPHIVNLPPEYQPVKSKMFSIKSTEDHGNIQLTIAPGTDPATGKPVTLLDTDIDEDGQLIAHLMSYFLHKFNGGTHPYNIYDYLFYQYGKGLNLGYDLI